MCSERGARGGGVDGAGGAWRWWLGGGGGDGGQTRTRRPRMTWVLVAFVGLVGGVVSGLFGVGGAIVIVPALVDRKSVGEGSSHNATYFGSYLTAGDCVPDGQI